MPPPQNAQDALSDPVFFKLPREEQKKVLTRLDPNYSNLPGPEQDKVIVLSASRMPLREGVKVVGKNAAGQDIYGTTDSTWEALKQTVSGAGTGAWNAAMSFPIGIASLFNPNMQEGENPLTANPAARMAKSEWDARGQLGGQADKYFSSGQPFRGVVTDVAGMIPFPGTSGMAAGINEAEDRGATGEALGEGLVGVGMLVGPHLAKATLPPLLKAGGKLFDKTTKTIKEGATGTGPKVVADYVANVARDNEGAIKEAREKTAVKQERVDEINKRRAEADTEKAKKIAEQNKATDERVTKINDKRSSADEERIAKAKKSNEDALREHDEAIAKADKENLESHIKHLAEKSQIERTNQEAGNVSRADEATGEHLKARTEEMDVRTEKAAHESLKKAEEMFKPLREKLGTFDAAPEVINNAVAEAVEKVGVAHPATSLLKDLAARIKGDTIGKDLNIPTEGETAYKNPKFSFADEQAFYSRLGREFSSGTLPGDIYSAYKVLQDKIGKDMQRIADAQGKGKELAAARDYWKRQRQAFGKSSDANTSRAEKEIAEDNPDYTKEQIRDFRRRLLEFFDPKISKLAAEIDEAKAKLKAKASETIKPVPEAPKPVEVKPPETQPVPKPRPALQAPSPKPVPEPRQPLSVKPVQADVKVVTPETLTQVKADAAIDKALSVQHSPGHIATVFLALDAIRRVFHGDVGGLGIDVGARGVYALGKNSYAKILMNPKVINAVSNLTAEDVAQAMRLPESQRSGFVELVKQADKQGIKVPAVALSLIAGASRSANHTPPLTKDHPLAGNPVQ
jgi:hypothetical protein